MPDRRLLELAAKAAGIEFNDKRAPTGGVALYCGPSGGWWNPLTDDGDALRLAVQLGLIVQCDGQFAKALQEWKGAWAQVPVGSCPYAATRRAIVMAAAKIGRGME